MQLIKKGKTKDVYQQDDGNYLLKFKDDMTGENGVFDPGANTVGLTVEGAGRAGLRLTEFFFKKIEEAGIETHFVAADIDNVTLTVKPAVIYGEGLEVICRYKAVGSFLKRYGTYVTEGQPLDAFVEVTLKDDDRCDPPITKDALEMLGIFKEGEYEQLKAMTQRICGIVKDELAKKGIDLYDIKLEFGRVNGKVALIDEISGGNMRAYKNGEYILPLQLPNLILC